MQTLVATVVCLAALVLIARLARGGPYRRGPWPGLTPTGGALLLAHALLLAGVMLLGPTDLDGGARGALPYLPLASAASVMPLVLAARLTGVPGAGAAVCGAYLLPRSGLSLVVPTVPLPPMLVAAAVPFEVALWLRRDDLVAVLDLWPTRRQRRVWRKRSRQQRSFSPPRAALAGGVFGLALAALEPPLALLLGADPACWAPEAAARAVPLSAITAAAGAWLTRRFSCQRPRTGR